MFYVGGAVGMRNMGTWAAGTTYQPNDVVSYNGSAYIATTVSTGNLPTNTSYFNLFVGGAAVYQLTAQTTATTAVALTFDGSNVANPTGTPANVLLIPTFTNILFELNVTVRERTIATASQGWLYSGLAARDSGSSRIVGTVTQLATWSETTTNGTVTVTANTASNYLSIVATPSNANTLNWRAVLTVNQLALTA